MLESFQIHNQFWQSPTAFTTLDPHLTSLGKLTYQHHSTWWQSLSLNEPGIYILTGGRQVGKSTSCKQLLSMCLQQQAFKPSALFYLPCDEVFDAQTLSQILRHFINQQEGQPFFIIIDEITFVKDWDRVIKALADEGAFQQGLCLLTGSDSLILKDAAMRFPGRRGNANQTDFHLYPLSFREYVQLVHAETTKPTLTELNQHFATYLICGGYLRAINDIANSGNISEATFQTYEQWIRGDFLKQGKNEASLLAVLQALTLTGVSQVSYSGLTQKIGLLSKETVIDYCRLLSRMDVIFTLQAFDQNSRRGFPRKARKIHFLDPFIQQTIHRWLNREGYHAGDLNEGDTVEACVASHYHRFNPIFYYKGNQGEIDIIIPSSDNCKAVEVKWSDQLKASDLKMLKHFSSASILTKHQNGMIDDICAIPVSLALWQQEED